MFCRNERQTEHISVGYEDCSDNAVVWGHVTTVIKTPNSTIKMSLDEKSSPAFLREARPLPFYRERIKTTNETAHWMPGVKVPGGIVWISSTSYLNTVSLKTPAQKNAQPFHSKYRRAFTERSAIQSILLVYQHLKGPQIPRCVLRGKPHFHFEREADVAEWSNPPPLELCN